MIGVVMLSHHPVQNLRAALSSLDLAHREAGAPPMKILIGYQDAREEAVAASLPPQRKFVLETRRLPEALSVPEARNVLLDARLGLEWVLYLDDDVTVPREYFQEFFKIRQRWPEAEIIGGPNLTPPDQHGLARDSGWLLATPLNWVCRDRYRHGREGRRSHFRDFILCNLFVHSSLAPRFKPNLPWGEELGLLRDEIDRGRVCVYAPRLEVFHRRRETLGAIREQMFRYGRGRGLWLADQPRALTTKLFRALTEMGAMMSWPLHAWAGGEYPEDARESSWRNRLRLLALLPRAYRDGVRAGLREGVASLQPESVRAPWVEGQLE